MTHSHFFLPKIPLQHLSMNQIIRRQLRLLIVLLLHRVVVGLWWVPVALRGLSVVLFWSIIGTLAVHLLLLLLHVYSLLWRLLLRDRHVPFAFFRRWRSPLVVNLLLEFLHRLFLLLIILLFRAFLRLSLIIFRRAMLAVVPGAAGAGLGWLAGLEAF